MSRAVTGHVRIARQLPRAACGRSCDPGLRYRCTGLAGRRRASLLFPLGIVALLALCAAHTPSDADWDLRNYHVYNAHALITGRFWTDIAPGAVADLLCAVHGHRVGAIRDRLDATPVLRNVVLSLPQGIAAALAFVLTLRIVPLPCLAASAGVAGDPVQRGRCGRLADARLGHERHAAGSLHAWRPVTADGETPGASPAGATRSATLAGLAFGVAAGLKLTCMPYCLAAGAALLAVPPRPPAKRLALLAAFGLAGLPGSG